MGYPIVDPVQSHSPLGSAVDGESYEGGVGEGWFGGMYLVRPGVSGVQSGRQVDGTRGRLSSLGSAAPRLLAVA